MRARPTSVTVIGWMAVLGCAFGLLALGMALGFSRYAFGGTAAYGHLYAWRGQPLPGGVAMGITGAFMAVNLACGIGLLRGANAARWGYAAATLLQAALGLVLAGHGPGATVVVAASLHALVPLVFLFLPRANRFFAGDDSDPGDAYGAWTAVGFLAAGGFLSAAVNMLPMAAGGTAYLAIGAAVVAAVGLAALLAALAGTGWRRAGRDVAVVLAIVLLAVGPGLPHLWKASRSIGRHGALAAPLTAFGRYDAAMEALRKAATPELRFYALGRAAKACYDAGRYDDARVLAEELEKAAPAYPTDWNYGNAIQDSNVVLGRLALRDGNVEEAKARLLAAGKSPGSPQMGSFGPNVSLAADLLAKGETDVVVQYFDLCRAFWKRPFSDKLDAWSEEAKRGEKPDFGANLLY